MFQNMLFNISTFFCAKCRIISTFREKASTFFNLTLHQKNKQIYFRLKNGGDSSFPFEMIVLDISLRTTVSRFRRHLTKIKLIFDKLSEDAISKPSGHSLEKLTSVKKSILVLSNRYSNIAIDSHKGRVCKMGH